MRSNPSILKRNGWLAALLVATACLCFDSCGHKTDNTAPTVSFNNDIVPILKTSCAISGCHAGSNPQKHLTLDSAVAYAQLTTKGYVIAGQPGNSIMYLQMTGSAPVMPPTGLLGNDKTDKVRDWIQQGAKDN